MTLNRACSALVALLLAAFPARAQQVERETIHYSIGTGFFIDKRGYLLTNAHVIEKCRKYVVYGHDSIMQANVIARDNELDLVLLKTTFPVDHSGAFYDPETPPAIGETLLTIGYPEDAWLKRRPVIGSAKLLGMKGPQDEPQLLQFTDTVKQGNSGGPLLDRSGNIVGIVSAQKILTETNSVTGEVLSVRHFGAGINAESVKTFLVENGVHFPTARSLVRLSQPSIAEKAKEYVVNVRCRVD